MWPKGVQFHNNIGKTCTLILLLLTYQLRGKRKTSSLWIPRLLELAGVNILLENWHRPAQIYVMYMRDSRWLMMSRPLSSAYYAYMYGVILLDDGHNGGIFLVLLNSGLIYI